MSQDPETPREQAVQRFMDALLTRAAEGDVADRRAMERALAALPGEDARSRWPRWLAAAASLLVTLGVWALIMAGPGAVTAEAALATVLEEVRRDALRAFEVVLDSGGPLARRGEATLYTQGTERLAMAVTGPRGRALWIGGSASERWAVPPFERSPVIISDDPAKVLEVIDEFGFSLPDVDLVEMITACARDFELEVSEDRRTIRGSRRGDDVDGPKTFVLRVGSEGELVELVLEGDRVRRTRGGWRMQLAPVELEVDPAVFDRTSHHGPERALVRR
jgi:hypothetical protein